MFYGCLNLASIDVSNFNTKNVETMDYLFRNCSKLTSLDISNFNTTKVKTMNFIFAFCTIIQKINLGKLDTSSVEDMRGLFYYNENLESADLSSFDTSKVTLMGWMFFHCYKIKSIILSEKFKTSNVVSMFSMFSHCKSLTSLDLSSFDTSKVTEMCYMFNNDFNLIYLDIPNFSPSNINTIYQMFFNMTSLIYLNINSLEINDQTNKTISFNLLKKSLKICANGPNLKNYLINQQFNNIDCSNICFQNNIKLDITNNQCINSCKDNGYKYEYNNICYNECPEGAYTILKDENNKNNIFIEFVDGVALCLGIQPEGYFLDNDGFYRECYEGCKICYGFGQKNAHNCKECKSGFLSIENTLNNNNCYEMCDNYYYFNEIDDYICTDNNECPNDYSKLVIEKRKCIDQCQNDNNYKYEYNNICYQTCPKGTIISSIDYHCLGEKNIYLNEIRNNEVIYQKLKENIIDKCNMTKGQEMTYEGLNDFLFHITSTENELDILEGKRNNTNNLSIVDLRKCENIFKSQYDINENASLIIMKFEKISNISSERTLQYEVYEPYNKTKLNLSLCGKNIDIYIPTILSEKTQHLYNELKELGYDLFDINSPFYNDICITFKSPEGTDVLLSDRVNNYFNNDDTSCQSNCKFSEYLMESQYLKCECDSKNSEIIINKAASFSGKSLYQSFYDVLKYSNYKVLKCFNLAISLKSFSLKNIGSILTLAYFLFYLIFLIVYSVKGIKKLKVSKIIRKHFGNNNDNKNKDKKGINHAKKSQKEKLYKSISKKYENVEYKENNNKLDNSKKFNNKDTNKKSIYHNPPRKKISIYKKPKSSFKFKNQEEKAKNIDNISSISKNSFIKSLSKRDLKENKHKFKPDKNKFDNYELNNLEYDLAKKFDRRNYCQIYWSFLKREHLVIFTLIIRDDHNISFVKFSRFFFLLCTDMALNVFFFADKTMHKLFIDYGKYNFIQQIPQIIYSTAVSQIIEIFICFLSLIDNYYYQIKECKELTKDFLKKIIRTIKIKIALFYIFTFLMFCFYWYLITCFCAVYQNTQIAFIKDSISSFVLGIFLPFIIYIFPSLFRIISLKSKSKIECVYKFSNLIPFF